MSFPSFAGQKRGRDGEDEGFAYDRAEKKARPASLHESSNPRDSLLNGHTAPPSPGGIAFQQPTYGHANHFASTRSSPGTSPSTDEDDEMEDVTMSSPTSSPATLPKSPSDLQLSPRTTRHPPLPFHQQAHQNQNQSLSQRPRNPTPIHPPSRSSQPKDVLIHHHIRARHPPETSHSAPSSTPGTEAHLSVPSPIDEDEVPTPPSAAAEAAGSQLSMLSMSEDMEMDGAAHSSTQPDESVPRISVATDADAADAGMAMDDTVPPTPAPLRKQRQRSGALSSGFGSPVRGDQGGFMDGNGAGGGRKGLSIGWRADCERCLRRVPGHMNHFV